MCILMAAAVGEMTANGDKPAMVVVVFCYVQDCAARGSKYGTMRDSCVWYGTSTSREISVVLF